MGSWCLKGYIYAFSANELAMKWDSEGHITLEVFRDMGIAFGVGLILIYGLMVGWFSSFTTPLVVMAASPVSLIGILPAHGLLGAFFTTTSMIGFMAGAGILVRNSIILVDFLELRLAEGMLLADAFNSSRRSGRRQCNFIRSDLSGPCHFINGWRGRFALYQLEGSADPILSGPGARS